jgi:LemA protein
MVKDIKKEDKVIKLPEQKKEISMGILIALGIVVGIIFILMLTVGWFIGSYNTFVVAKQDINNQWSNVLTEYQARNDKLNNMVEVVLSYSKFEKSTMVEVTQARSSINNVNLEGLSKDQQMQQLGSLDSALSKLMVVFEKYPELKSIEQYNKLNDEIVIIENRIQIARTDYNALIRSYNILVSTFPKSMLANKYGYKQEKYFVNEAGTDKAPDLKDALRN